MPDRSLRLLTLPQQSAPGGGRSAAVLLRERPSSPPDAPSGQGDGEGRGGAQQDDNPFAPPPEGTPDQPWRPRHPTDGDGSREGGRTPWGGQWSDRQPGRSASGFGERSGGSGHGAGPGPGGPAGGSGPRWDPADPVQRRARYALLSGMWTLFFALFSWPYVALLLGALALYWGISALRAKPRAADPDGPAAATGVTGATGATGATGTRAPERTGGLPQTGRPQTTAAVSGLVTASLGLLLVAATFAAQLVYSDYYTCRSDALTREASQTCDRHLPDELRGVLGTEN
ncbi:hypothetical protein [Streptomyces ziwulingensis]|uniref:Integral membrane protein n=1 Tax=Streptomyces ziwulingensis TaxID=1045501 RepID=A0ABP9CG41_9ACTN